MRSKQGLSAFEDEKSEKEKERNYATDGNDKASLFSAAHRRLYTWKHRSDCSICTPNMSTARLQL